MRVLWVHVDALREKNLRGMGSFAFAVPPCCPILAGCPTNTGGVREDILFFSNLLVFLLYRKTWRDAQIVQVE